MRRRTRTVRRSGRPIRQVTCEACGEWMDESIFPKCFTCTVGPQGEGESDRDYRERAIRVNAQEAARLQKRGNVRRLPHRRSRKAKSRKRTERDAVGREMIRAPRYL